MYISQIFVGQKKSPLESTLTSWCPPESPLTSWCLLGSSLSSWCRPLDSPLHHGAHPIPHFTKVPISISSYIRVPIRVPPYIIGPIRAPLHHGAHQIPTFYHGAQQITPFIRLTISTPPTHTHTRVHIPPYIMYLHRQLLLTLIYNQCTLRLHQGP